MPFSVGHITKFVRVNRRFRLEPVLVSNRAVPSLLRCKRALNLSVPNQFFWYAYVFHPSRAKNFRPCKWGVKARLHVKREGTARLETSTGSRRNLLFTRTNFVMCPTEKGTVLESPLERVLDCLHVVFFETGNDRASDN